MSVLSDLNKKMFGGTEYKSKSLLNEQQQGTMDDIMGSAQTYRDMAQGSQSMYNQGWEGMQQNQVEIPMQQRMANNVRDLQASNRKSGRATSAIGKRLAESASLRMNEMKVQQGVIENQRRIAMEQEARQRSLGYESQANQQLQTVLGRRAKENYAEETGGIMTPVMKIGGALLASKGIYDSADFSSKNPTKWDKGNWESAPVNAYTGGGGGNWQEAPTSSYTGGKI